MAFDSVCIVHRFRAPLPKEYEQGLPAIEAIKKTNTLAQKIIISFFFAFRL
jgi:hypothetical protein